MILRLKHKADYLVDNRKNWQTVRESLIYKYINIYKHILSKLSMATDLTIYEGEDKTWLVTILDSAGDPVDITGYTFLFVVKSNICDADADAIIKKEITSHQDPTNGVTQIPINEADTENLSGKYTYDYQWSSTASDRKVVLKKAGFLVEQRVGDSFN